MIELSEKDVDASMSTLLFYSIFAPVSFIVIGFLFPELYWGNIVGFVIGFVLILISPVFFALLRGKKK